jgi:hypothetical protein
VAKWNKSWIVRVLGMLVVLVVVLLTWDFLVMNLIKSGAVEAR